MASTAKTTNYTNRKVDVLALDGTFSDKLFELDQHLYGKSNTSGKVCSGVQKLVQRWLIEFLTPKGSLLYLPDRGSSFLSLVRSGRVRTEFDAAIIFNSAKAEVEFNLLQEDLNTTYQDDEKYGSVDLLGVQVVAGSKLTISLRINSLAGASRVFVVPVSVVPSR